MKKNPTILVIAILCLGIQNLAHADSFIYSSQQDCTAAMDKYNHLADQMRQKEEPLSEPWKGFVSMAIFFAQIGNFLTPLRETCLAGNCTSEGPLACHLATGEFKNNWVNLVVPLLTKEVNLLNNKQYDLDLIPTSSTYKVTCHYPEGSKDKLKNCSIALW